MKWPEYTRIYYDENGTRWVNEDDALRLITKLQVDLATAVEALQEAADFPTSNKPMAVFVTKCLKALVKIKGDT